jgi:hypothetical protein
MCDMQRLIRRARIRIESARLLRTLNCAAIILACVLLLCAIADRVTDTPFLPWIRLAPSLAAAALIMAIVHCARTRRTEHQVAAAIDDKLDLKEKLATALCRIECEDVFSYAVINDAEAIARDPQRLEEIRRQFPIAPPRGWRATPILLVAVVAVSAAPQAGLITLHDHAPAPPPNHGGAFNAGDAPVEFIAAINEPATDDASSSPPCRDVHEGPDPTVFGEPERIDVDVHRGMLSLTCTHKHYIAERIGEHGLTVSVPVTDGDICASLLLDGALLRGELSAKLKEIARRRAEGEDEPVRVEDLPPRYHDAYKHYFGELERQVAEAIEIHDELHKGDDDDATDDESADSGGDAGTPAPDNH